MIPSFGHETPTASARKQPNGSRDLARPGPMRSRPVARVPVERRQPSAE